MKKPKKAAKWDEHFATRALLVIAITTAIFTAAQYVSFLITRQEQTVLIQYYFTVVGIECGGMLLKRIMEVITARIRKKEKLNPPPEGTTDSAVELPTVTNDETGGVG